MSCPGSGCAAKFSLKLLSLDLVMLSLKDQEEEVVFLTLIFQALFLTFLVQIFLMTFLKVLVGQGEEAEEDPRILEAQTLDMIYLFL